jgi:hypothetical protein
MPKLIIGFDSAHSRVEDASEMLVKAGRNLNSPP